MRKILLIGKNGQVGWELQRTLQPLGEVIPVGRRPTPHTSHLTIDLENPDSIQSVVSEVKPGLIVNAAAYTAVDKAEEEPDLAMAINGIAPGILAEEAKRVGAAIIHYSTDYVFDGTKDTPYTEDDAPNPINMYGKTKLAGEQAVQAIDVPYLILRSSWVYGARGNNFVLTILRLARERDELRIVDDQIGTPTWSRMIAETTAQILVQCLAPSDNDTQPLVCNSGVYHLSASGQTSWYGFAKFILSHADKLLQNRKTRLIPISSAEYPSAAQRPPNSLLNHEKLMRRYGLAMPDWEDGLELCLEEMAQ